MLKSLLIGLDGTGDGDSALELGLRWAKRFDATAAGLAVVDEPGIRVSEAGLLTEVRHWHAGELLLDQARQLAEETLRRFERRCEEAGVRHLTLEDTGAPYVQILREAQRFDLILLGQRTHFDFGWEAQADQTVAKVLRDAPRPVVAVPKAPAAGDAVLIAYDGSLQAARTLAAFEPTGLGSGADVHLVSVARDPGRAHRHADWAAEFLRSHGIEPHVHAIDTTLPPAEVILKQAARLGAGLLVMGAYGQPAIREFFLGSATATVLSESGIPVFCFH